MSIPRGWTKDWTKDYALEIVAAMEKLLDELRDATQGSDSALVSLKLTTLESSLALIRAYITEAAKVAL